MNRRSLFRSMLGALASIFTFSRIGSSKTSSADSFTPIVARLRAIYEPNPNHPLDNLIPGNEDGFTYRELAGYIGLMCQANNAAWTIGQNRPNQGYEHFYHLAEDVRKAAHKRQCGKIIRDRRDQAARASIERDKEERERKRDRVAEARILEEQREMLKSVVNTGREGQDVADSGYLALRFWEVRQQESVDHYQTHLDRIRRELGAIAAGTWHLTGKKVCTCGDGKHLVT
jgi:hypothetical protein